MKRGSSILSRNPWPRRFTIIVVAVLIATFMPWWVFDHPVRLLATQSNAEWIWLARFAPEMLVAIAAGIQEFRRRRFLRQARVREQANQCTRCGYDLRGAMTTTCPECGLFHGKQPARQFVR